MKFQLATYLLRLQDIPEYRILTDRQTGLVKGSRWHPLEPRALKTHIWPGQNVFITSWMNLKKNTLNSLNINMESRHCTYLDKSVNSHDGHIWLRLGIVHQIQVNQLLQLKIVRLHTVDNIGEQSWDIFAHCHRCYDLKNKFIMHITRSISHKLTSFRKENFMMDFTNYFRTFLHKKCWDHEKTEVQDDTGKLPPSPTPTPQTRQMIFKDYPD